MNYTSQQIMLSLPLVLLLTISSTYGLFTSPSSGLSSSSSSSLSSSLSSASSSTSPGKTSSDLGSSESRSHAQSAPSESNSAVLYSLSKAMANVLAASRYRLNEPTAQASTANSASALPASVSSPITASASPNDESPEDYAPKRKTVILAIPVKLALQQAASASAVVDRPTTTSSLGHLPSTVSSPSLTSYSEEPRHPSLYSTSNADGNSGSISYPSGQNGPHHIQQQQQLISYQGQIQSPVTPVSNTYQPPSGSQGTVVLSPGAMVKHSSTHQPSGSSSQGNSYGHSSSNNAAPLVNDRPTYSDKAPGKEHSYSNENEVDNSQVEANGNAYLGNAQSYENAPPALRVRGQAPNMKAEVESEYEGEDAVTPPKKSKKIRPSYYLEESSAETDDTYLPVSKTIKEKASSPGDVLDAIDFVDPFTTTNGLRNAASSSGFSDEDYTSAISGVPPAAMLASLPLYPGGDISSLFLKGQRNPYHPLMLAAGPYPSAHRASNFGYPRPAAPFRPLYPSGASSSPYSTSSPYFRSTYPGSSAASSKLYLPNSYSPFKSPYSPDYAGLRVSGSVGKGVALGGKGVRIGPLEFSSAGSSLFPTIKIKSPIRNV